MKRFLLLTMALALVFAGCAKKEVVQTEQPIQETTQKAVTTEPAVKKEEPAKTEAPAVVKAEPKKVETVPVKEVVEAKPAAFENIHFDFDKYFIRDDAKPAVKTVSGWLLKNNNARMLLEGHCDERGTNEYNLALGERRAKSTRDYLVSLGVKKDRLDIISFGEEKPLCQEQNEVCWQKNRRSQFIVK